MVRSLVYLLFFAVPLVFIACIDEPELPPEPKIKLATFGFKPANDFQDSLIIELEFEDGDGDLGLISFDTLPPFHEMDSVKKPDGSYVKLEDKNTPEYDTLPPYGDNTTLCRFWETVIYRENGTIHEAVFYVNRNPHHFNYHLDILVKKGDNFEVYDFLDENCTSGLNGRFFPLNTTGKKRPLEGVLRYGVQAGFKYLFPTETLKLRIYIEDRQLHKSNTVESGEFKLSDFLTI